ncbi:hypothetical protein B0J12DRAFT_254237 [Macrophomina phaseolina]|uniref:EF-hand domain-containing protein n=1 Tax=Macrophomina phaseolina TaxID=35725 RepID=A0ABQ8FZY3_9PEZI|nr:hypothetical protein B0J12DRAFT_254237 [Macrophomina phaseolina]
MRIKATLLAARKKPAASTSSHSSFPNSSQLSSFSVVRYCLILNNTRCKDPNPITLPNPSAKMISPKTATTLLATLALAAFVSAAPLESPDKYGSDITPIDIDGDGKISKWELGQKWQPSAEFFQFILEHQQKSCQQQPQPFYKKRDAAPEAEAEAEADPCFDGSCGKPAYYPEPNQPYYPEPNPPYKPGFLPPNKPGFLPPGKPGFFPPTPQFPPFPPSRTLRPRTDPAPATPTSPRAAPAATASPWTMASSAASLVSASISRFSTTPASPTSSSTAATNRAASSATAALSSTSCKYPCSLKTAAAAPCHPTATEVFGLLCAVCGCRNAKDEGHEELWEQNGNVVRRIGIHHPFFKFHSPFSFFFLDIFCLLRSLYSEALQGC